MFQEGTSAIGYLTTRGRVSGRPHRVILRLVYHQGRFYASRRNAACDWCRNLVKDPKVTVEMEGREFPGMARLVDDDGLAETISRLKYQDDRSQRRRVIVEITPADV